MSSRESIYSALFALVSSSSVFITSSRKLVPFSEVTPDQQPAIYQAQRTETALVQNKMPTVWRYEVDIYLYAYSNDPNLPPAIQLNQLLDALQCALDPSSGQEAQTLGGLVTYSRINGRIQTDEGCLGPQAVAVVPVEILVNN